MTRKTFRNLITTAYGDFMDDKAMRLAASLSFYALFALGPMLIIIIAVAGLVWGRRAVRGEIVGQFSSTLGEAAASQIEEIVTNANRSHAGVAATIIGLVTLLVAATGLFSQLKGALNLIWGVHPKPGLGVRRLIRDRLYSFAALLVVAFMLLVTLAASTAINAASEWMSGALPAPGILLEGLESAVSFGVVTVLFAAIFKWLPDVRIDWKYVWTGAAITALLFSVGKFVLGWYLGRSTLASVYGASGSLIVILLWVYYTSIIFLGGAEFTQVYARQRGANIQPSPIAEFINTGDRQQARLRSGHMPTNEFRGADGAARRPQRRRVRTIGRPRTRAVGTLLFAAAADVLITRLERANRMWSDTLGLNMSQPRILRGPDGSILLWVKAVPGASRDEIAGVLGDRLKVRVAAPPEAGKANEAVCALIAGALGIKSRDVRIHRGDSSPEKVVRIDGMTAASVLARVST